MMLILLIVVLLGFTQAQIDPQMKEDIDTFVEEIIECRGKIGMNLAIVQDGAPLYTTGYGYADLENGIPDDGATIHAIYSISKSIVVTLFATVIEETQITWDSLITDMLPSFRFRDEERNKGLKLRDLLGHVTGIPERLNAPYDSKAQFLDVVQCQDPVMGMRESFCYVDKNYYLAGAILEHLTNQTLSQLMQDRILTPLQMNSTLPSLAQRFNESIGKWAYGYRLTNGEVVSYRTPGRKGEITETLNAAAMGVLSTAEDMAEYMTFHLGAYRNDGTSNPVVDADILREMYHPNQAINFFTSFLQIDGLDDIDETWRVYDYGMGFWIGNFRESDFIQHGGNGYHDSLITMFKQWNLGIYTSMNGPSGIDSHATITLIQFYIADVLRGNTPIYNISYACNFTLPEKDGAYCGPFNIHPDHRIDKTRNSTSSIESYTGLYEDGSAEFKIRVDPNTATLVMTKGCEEYHLYPSGAPHAFVAQSTGECFGCRKRIVFTVSHEAGLIDDFSSVNIDGEDFRNAKTRPTVGPPPKCDVSLANEVHHSWMCVFSLVTLVILQA